MRETDPAPIPVTVIGGYLGAGKTTLINHLLRNAGGRRLAILVNEFGELPIDEDLIEAEGDALISLAGGCVCCSYGSDLIEAMKRLAGLEPRPDNVLLEASGVALPGSIAGTLSLMPDYFVDGVVVLADAETLRQRAADRYMGDTVLRQLCHADIVLLNKADLVPAETIAAIREWLGDSAPGALVIESERSAVPPAVVLQHFDRAVADNRAAGAHRHAGFETRKLEIDDPVDADEFAGELLREYTGLVRAKGFVKDRDGTMKTIQIVGKRIEVSAAPAGVASGLVIISAK